MLQKSERLLFDARFAALWAIDPALIIPVKNRHAATLERVKKAGVLKIGTEIFSVTDTATYTETDDRFKSQCSYVVTELTLFSFKSGETRYLEWSKDDGFEISLTERKLTKAEIKSLSRVNGRSVDLDDDIDDIVDAEDSLIWKVSLYCYSDDWSAIYMNTDGRKSYVFICEFGDPNTGWLTVEAWSDDGRENGPWEYDVFISHDLQPSAIEIISTGT